MYSHSLTRGDEDSMTILVSDGVIVQMQKEAEIARERLIQMFSKAHGPENAEEIVDNYLKKNRHNDDVKETLSM